ncbi:YveK family protein [Anaerococcus rubeinfantis]|uniref:YveK family protein n=1 Tax=Anaerococcus rubeinfantis TaxID=1720199 RepID=UPI00073E52E9|nr:capsular biosynthesis protein [Anaerococcus rubeinfantis]
MKKRQTIFSIIPKALVFGLILGIGFYFLSGKLGFKKYKAQAKILTTSNEKIKEDDKTAYTYAETVNSNAIKKRVIENLKLDMEASELDKKMQIQAIPNTHILNINVEDSVKLRAEDIADEYAEITVSVINELYKADAVVIDHAYPNGSLLKNNEKDSFKVGLAGFLTYMIFGSLALTIRNSKINEEEIVEEKEIRKVVFKDEDEEENYEYDSFDQSFYEDEDHQIENQEFVNEDENVIDEKVEEEIDYDQSYKYVDSIEEDDDLDDDFRTYQNKENDKDYTIIADMPKYDDGDLNV